MSFLIMKAKKLVFYTEVGVMKFRCCDSPVQQSDLEFTVGSYFTSSLKHSAKKEKLSGSILINLMLNDLGARNHRVLEIVVGETVNAYMRAEGGDCWHVTTLF
jgi:hypothetical protein